MSTPVRRAIYGALASDTGNGGLFNPSMLGSASAGQSIFHDQASDNAQFPFIVLGKSSGVPAYTFGDSRQPAPTLPKDPRPPGLVENEIWLIKAVVRGDDALTVPGNNSLGQSASDRAEQIADRVRTLLNDYPLSISGSNCLYLRRESDVEYPELADGVIYRHCGALYRLITD